MRLKFCDNSVNFDQIRDVTISVKHNITEVQVTIISDNTLYVKLSNLIVRNIELIELENDSNILFMYNCMIGSISEDSIIGVSRNEACIFKITLFVQKIVAEDIKDCFLN